MTEEEALTKWCPFARIIPGTVLSAGDTGVSHDVSAFNRIGYAYKTGSGLHTSAMCIGRDCMAWRSTGLTDNGKREPTGSCGLVNLP